MSAARPDRREIPDSTPPSRDSRGPRDSDPPDSDPRDSDPPDSDPPDSEPASERPRASWPELHLAGVVVGWAALAGLGVALGSRLDRWSVVPFVALLYTAALGAVVASVAARRGRLGRGAVARRALWVLVALLLLWVWFPPMAYPVGWVYRHVALLFLVPP